MKRLIIIVFQSERLPNGSLFSYSRSLSVTAPRLPASAC